MKRILCGLVALGVVLAAAGMTKADYTFTSLDVPGSTSTMAYGINDSGQIVGTYQDAGGTLHGFLLSGGIYSTLDVPGSASTAAYGINAAGQIVGGYSAGGYDTHGFLLTGGSYTTLDVPGSESTQANGPTMTIASGTVTGTLSFVQATPGSYGTMGNYELVVPLLSGGMAHFYRNNDDPNLPWTMTATFGTSLGVVGGVSLIQSNFSTEFVQTGAQGPGNFAVVSVANNQADYFYRDDQ